MKSVIRHKQFAKNFRSRVLPHKKLTKQFEVRMELFLRGERGYPLHDHALTGGMAGLRAFSIGGDMRVVYRESKEHYELLDIGTHNQVY